MRQTKANAFFLYAPPSLACALFKVPLTNLSTNNRSGYIYRNEMLAIICSWGLSETQGQNSYLRTTKLSILAT